MLTRDSVRPHCQQPSQPCLFVGTVDGTQQGKCDKQTLSFRLRQKQKTNCSSMTVNKYRHLGLIYVYTVHYLFVVQLFQYFIPFVHNISDLIFKLN